MFYLFTISGASLLIALCNFLADGVYAFAAFAWLLLYTAAGVACVIGIDGLLAFIVRRLPARWFAPTARAFSVPHWEKELYRKTKINVWKKHVPEWGCFTGFHKDQLRSPNDSAYIGRFLLESNYGVLGHVLGSLFGFFIMLLPFLRPLSVALPIAIVNFVLNMLPALILRFNTPSLRRLYNRNLAREKGEK